MLKHVPVNPVFIIFLFRRYSNSCILFTPFLSYLKSPLHSFRLLNLFLPLPQTFRFKCFLLFFFVQKCRSISTYKASLCPIFSIISHFSVLCPIQTAKKQTFFDPPQTEAPGYMLPPCFRSYKYHPREARFAHHLPGLPPHLPETPAVNSGAVHLDSTLSEVLYFVSDIKIPGTPAFPAARPSALPEPPPD